MKEPESAFTEFETNANKKSGLLIFCDEIAAMPRFSCLQVGEGANLPRVKRSIIAKDAKEAFRELVATQKEYPKGIIRVRSANAKDQVDYFFTARSSWTTLVRSEDPPAQNSRTCDICGTNTTHDYCRQCATETKKGYTSTFCKQSDKVNTRVQSTDKTICENCGKKKYAPRDGPTAKRRRNNCYNCGILFRLHYLPSYKPDNKKTKSDNKCEHCGGIKYAPTDSKTLRKKRKRCYSCRCLLQSDLILEPIRDPEKISSTANQTLPKGDSKEDSEETCVICGKAKYSPLDNERDRNLRTNCYTCGVWFEEAIASSIDSATPKQEAKNDVKKSEVETQSSISEAAPSGDSESVGDENENFEKIDSLDDSPQEKTVSKKYSANTCVICGKTKYSPLDTKKDRKPRTNCYSCGATFDSSAEVSIKSVFTPRYKIEKKAIEQDIATPVEVSNKEYIYSERKKYDKSESPKNNEDALKAKTLNNKQNHEKVRDVRGRERESVGSNQDKLKSEIKSDQFQYTEIQEVNESRDTKSKKILKGGVFGFLVILFVVIVGELFVNVLKNNFNTAQINNIEHNISERMQSLQKAAITEKSLSNKVYSVQLKMKKVQTYQRNYEENVIQMCEVFLSNFYSFSIRYKQASLLINEASSSSSLPALSDDVVSQFESTNFSEYIRTLITKNNLMLDTVAESFSSRKENNNSRVLSTAVQNFNDFLIRVVQIHGGNNESDLVAEYEIMLESRKGKLLFESVDKCKQIVFNYRQ